MKKIGLVICVFTILALLSGVALAGQNQNVAAAAAGKSVSTAPEAGNKMDSCTANDSAIGNNNILLADSCINQGYACVLNGTPCCAPYSCKGKFPNTYCQ